MRISRILTAVDLSEASLEAVRYSVDMARSFGAEIVLFHAVEPIVMAGDPFPVPAAVSVLAQVEESARKRLERIAARLRKGGVRCRIRIENGTPAATIVRAAGDLKAGLVVMGTHGNTGLSHLLLGSVAERVVRTAACPVLTVRAPAPRGKRRARKR
jgi:nucleotide-binding universal stress UspA family protein